MAVSTYAEVRTGLTFRYTVPSPHTPPKGALLYLIHRAQRNMATGTFSSLPDGPRSLYAHTYRIYSIRRQELRVK